MFCLYSLARGCRLMKTFVSYIFQHLNVSPVSSHPVCRLVSALNQTWLLEKWTKVPLTLMDDCSSSTAPVLGCLLPRLVVFMLNSWRMHAIKSSQKKRNSLNANTKTQQFQNLELCYFLPKMTVIIHLTCWQIYVSPRLVTKTVLVF